MAVKSEEVEMIESARAFCLTIDRTIAGEPNGLIEIRNALLRIYVIALRIADFQNGPGADLPFTFSCDQQAKMTKDLANATAANYFSLSFSPFNLNEAPVVASIADALADIYRDLKPGLLSLESDEPRWLEDVLLDWQFSFQIHWGDHAIDSLWAIHKWLRDHAPK